MIEDFSARYVSVKSIGDSQWVVCLNGEPISTVYTNKEGVFGANKTAEEIRDILSFIILDVVKELGNFSLEETPLSMNDITEMEVQETLTQNETEDLFATVYHLIAQVTFLMNDNEGYQAGFEAGKRWALAQKQPNGGITNEGN